jgi:hypothetical protein
MPGTQRGRRCARLALRGRRSRSRPGVAGMPGTQRGRRCARLALRGRRSRSRPGVAGIRSTQCGRRCARLALRGRRKRDGASCNDGSDGQAGGDKGQRAAPHVFFIVLASSRPMLRSREIRIPRSGRSRSPDRRSAHARAPPRRLRARCASARCSPCAQTRSSRRWRLRGRSDAAAC